MIVSLFKCQGYGPMLDDASAKPPNYELAQQMLVMYVSHADIDLVTEATSLRDALRELKATYSSHEVLSSHAPIA